MVNPGAFQNSHKEFLVVQKPAYAQAGAGGFMHDCIADIQRCYFKCYPIDYPHEQEMPIAYNLWAHENQNVVDLSCLAARANLLKKEFAGTRNKLTRVVPTIFMINLKQMPAQASVSSQG